MADRLLPASRSGSPQSRSPGAEHPTCGAASQPPRGGPHVSGAGPAGDAAGPLPSRHTAPDHLRAIPHGTNRVVACLFAAAIALPLVATLILLALRGPEPSGDLAAWAGPVTSVKDLGRWPTRFRRWFHDHYAFRRDLIRAHGTLLLGALHVSPSRTVLIGKDGWWYYADDGALEDIASATLMSVDELEEWRAGLDRNAAWLEAQGVPYLFVLAPDKHAIYPEFLPDSVHALGPSRLGQLVDDLRARSRVNVLDLRSPLLDTKRTERVFHRTDTHWNKRGALVAYLAMTEWLASVRPGTHVPTRSEFRFSTVIGGGHDLPRMLGVERLVSEEILEVHPREAPRARVVEPTGDADLGGAPVVITEHPDRTLPRMVIFRDSFMTPVIPFLAEQCSRCVFLWQNNFDREAVRREHPDVVIQELVGRRLQGATPW